VEVTATMDLGLALLTLLHVLVFVYWLGGDLGAFYASHVLTDTTRPPAARAAAAHVLMQVDMAPRTALILAAPTGFTLAVAQGWWPAPPWGIAAAWIGSLAWLALAWVLHLKHLQPGSLWRRIDLFIRWAVLIKLALIALAPQFFPWTADIPLFLRLKLAALAGAIACGLWIRRCLAPFGPAYVALASGAPTAEHNAIIASTLQRARPFVVLIWTLLIAAAFLGLARPL
jgi:hypothetical protein